MGFLTRSDSVRAYSTRSNPSLSQALRSSSTNSRRKDVRPIVFSLRLSHPFVALDTDFVALGAANSSWNVVRSEFDELLLNHSKESGAEVYESTKVTSFDFGRDHCPVSATWTSTVVDQDGDTSVKQGRISFDYVVDASGRSGLIAAKYLKTRQFNATLKNIGETLLKYLFNSLIYYKHSCVGLLEELWLLWAGNYARRCTLL